MILAQRTKSRGFTALELVVSMAIIVIIISGALSFVSPNKSSIASDFEFKLIQLFRDTRKLALKNNRSYFIHVHEDSIYHHTNPVLTRDNKLTPTIFIPNELTLQVKLDQRSFHSKKSSDSVSILISKSGLIENTEIQIDSNSYAHSFHLHPLTSLPIIENEE